MIVTRINEWARSHPSDIAFISDGRALTYGAFARSIERTRIFLEGNNLPLGKTAIILETPRIEVWLCVMACRAVGLNTLCISSIKQIETLKQKDIACYVVAEADAWFQGHSLRDLPVLTVPEATFSSVHSGDPLPEPNYATQFGSHILLTSGTTGTYKKVFFDAPNEDRRNAARAHAYRLTKNTVYHAADLGLWTTIGFRMPLAVWHIGGCVITDRRHSVFSNFLRHDVNFSILTPPQLKQLVENSKGVSPMRENCELQITSGFLPMDLANAAMRHLAKNIGISYGSTELSTPALLSRSSVEGEELYWLAPVNRKVRIVDENGDDCPPGQEGELRIQLWDIDCDSYLDDEETSKKIFRDGFFCPGDMAVSRADGRVRVLGRAVDVLHLRGNKHAVAPFELAVQRALMVDEVCLFSGLNHAGEEELVVAIESDRTLPQSSVDQIARTLPAFERIRIAYVKKFPRVATGTGKIARTVLRSWVFNERKWIFEERANRS
jgi:acyl-coenzyme A synthetase/AMP-(fatty) acid ligase